jgi:hypothetical protein
MVGPWESTATEGRARALTLSAHRTISAPNDSRKMPLKQYYYYCANAPGQVKLVPKPEPGQEPVGVPVQPGRIRYAPVKLFTPATHAGNGRRRAARGAAAEGRWRVRSGGERDARRPKLRRGERASGSGRLRSGAGRSCRLGGERPTRSQRNADQPLQLLDDHRRAAAAGAVRDLRALLNHGGRRHGVPAGDEPGRLLDRHAPSQRVRRRYPGALRDDRHRVLRVPIGAVSPQHPAGRERVPARGERAQGAALHPLAHPVLPLRDPPLHRNAHGLGGQEAHRAQDRARSPGHVEGEL